MIRPLSPDEFPELLKEIPRPPKEIRYEGMLPIKGNKLLAIVGSRKYSTYGREACETLIGGLAGSPITIVSGLAIGIDGIAHRAAIKAGLQTIAVPGSGLNRKMLYPRSHVELAKEIIENGGGLLSEYPDDLKAAPWTFPQRNRIMAGLCHAVLVIEAEEKSGTLITSRLATDYNRDVGCVPGPIDSSTSAGPHMLMRLGAAVIRNSDDIRELLGLERKEDALLLEDNLSSEETLILSLLETPSSKNELIRKSGLETGLATSTFALLEIKGLIKEDSGEVKKNV